MDEWDIPWLKIILVCCAIGVVLFMLNAVGFTSYSVWAPKFEEARRKTFEESPSFVHGKRQYLTRLYGEWQRAEPAHRGAICEVARQEASTLNPKHLTPSLAEWKCVK